jgi:hypothetical protein
VVDLNPFLPYIIGGAVGSVLTFVFTTIRDHYRQQHQFRLDIARNRIEVFGTLSNDYLLLASALAEFRQRVVRNLSNDMEKFYFISKFFSHYSKIAEESGGFEFQNRLGEDISTHLVGEIFKIFSSVFEYEVFSEMIDQVTSDDGKIIRYNKFKRKIQEELFSRFQDNILSNQILYDNLTQYSKWLEGILMFEINMGFRYWYKEEPLFELNKEFVNYLLEKKAYNYIKRLKLSNKSKIEKFLYIKGNYY